MLKCHQAWYRSSNQAFESKNDPAGNFMLYFLTSDVVNTFRSSNSLQWDIIGIQMYSGHNRTVTV